MPERFQGKPSRRRADAELALGQVDELDAGVEREAERAEAAVGIDAVAVELAGSTGGKDEDRRSEERRGRRDCPAVRAWANRQDAADPARRAPRLGQDLHGRRVVEDRDAEADRLLGQHLHHQPRGARAAAGGAADLVVVGLVAQRAAERGPAAAAGRDTAARPCARERADRLDVGGVLVHRAAGADRARHRLDSRRRGRRCSRCAASACPSRSRPRCRPRRSG